MNIVLIEPEIPWNTGNVGRTCVGTNSPLHIVGKCGFSLSDRQLKRAGLDYWQHLDLKIHKSWPDFLDKAGSEKILFFEKDGRREFWEADFEPGSYLVFGNETRGFPKEMEEKYRSTFYRIPMSGPIRSLNLSTSVAVVLYEALRQTRRKKPSKSE